MREAGGFAEPWVAFIFPSLVHTVVFRREASRKSAALKPFRSAPHSCTLQTFG